MSNIEQTLSIIKPDAVERNLENEIKEMFRNNGFNILKEKINFYFCIFNIIGTVYGIFIY